MRILIIKESKKLKKERSQKGHIFLLSNFFFITNEQKNTRLLKLPQKCFVKYCPFYTSTSTAQFSLALHDSNLFPLSRIHGTGLLFSTFILVPSVSCWPGNATSENCGSLVG